MQHIHETWHTQTYTYQSDLPLILVGWCSLSTSPSPPNNIGQEQLTSGRHTHLNEYNIPSSEQHCLRPCQEKAVVYRAELKSINYSSTWYLWALFVSCELCYLHVTRRRLARTLTHIHTYTHTHTRYTGPLRVNKFWTYCTQTGKTPTS